MKKFKLHVTAEVELPSKAELISFTDEDGVTTDHIKIGGKLLRPDLIWMEYAPSKRQLNQKNWHPDMASGWNGGTDFTEDIEDRTNFTQWYIEETSTR